MVVEPETPLGVSLIAVGNDDAALVDTADYERLAAFRWFLSNGYAARVEQRPSGGWRLVRMHHDLLRPPPGKVIDHRNRDRLDNRRDNLRIASYRLNTLNASASRRNRSGCIGVDWRAARQRWRARLRHGRNGETLLGHFAEREDAIAARLIALETLLSSLT